MILINMDKKYRMINAIKIQKILFTITCSWPYENETLFYKIFKVLWTTMSISYTGLLFMEAALNGKEKNIVKMTLTLSLAILCVSFLAKYAGFLTSRKIFLEMINLMDDKLFYTHDDELNRHLIKAIRTCKAITMMFFISAQVYVIAHSITPIFNNSNLPITLSVDFGNWTPLIYFIEVAGLAHPGITNAAIDTISVSFLILGTAQFDILKEKLINLKSEKGTEELMETLTNAVQQHNLIIK